MQRALSILVVTMAMVVATTILPSSLAAQSIWLDRSHDKTISLEILKPDFQGKDNTTFTTSALFLSLRYPLTEKVIFVAELPFPHYGIESAFGYSESDNTLGNPYVGLEIRQPDSPVFGELGIRAPLTDEEKHDSAIWHGVLTDLVDRFEAFMPDYLPITGMVNYRHKNSSGFALRLRGGPVFWINTEKKTTTKTALNCGLVTVHRSGMNPNRSASGVASQVVGGSR